jgi:hypothetical protein
VQRLLLLEALQQLGESSLLAPALRSDWQQQQHLDLGRAARGGSSSSSSSGDEPLILERMWMPQLLTALLQHGVCGGSGDSAAALRDLELGRDWAVQQQQQQQQQRATGVESAVAGAACDGFDDSSMVAPPNLSGYRLACLSGTACRASLACWVLMWHARMVQQGGDYDSAVSR